MIDFDDFGQSVQEIFRAVQGVNMRLGSIFGHDFKRVEHNRRDAKNAGLLANSMTFMVGNGLAYDYAADMPCSQNLHCRIGRGNWYDPIPSMRQNRIADG